MILYPHKKKLIKRITVFSLFWISFIGYFIIPLFTKSIPCPNWILKIDYYIPFVWWMIIPYYSYYILIIIPPFIIKNQQKINFLTTVLIQASTLCFIIYLIWPISSSHVLSSVQNNPLSYFHDLITFEYLHQNAFPSMHVSVCTIIGLAIWHHKSKYKNIMIFIITSIFLATFLIKQHYLVDSVSGLILGYLGFIKYKKLLQ